MRVVVNKGALKEAIKNIVEQRGIHSQDISAIVGQVPEEPIVPVEMVATQLAHQKPPVDDPDYIPASPRELSYAAQVISEAVPDSQVEFYYRWLHKLLDKAIDREEKASGSEFVSDFKALENMTQGKDVEITESSIRNIVSSMLTEIEKSEDLYDVETFDEPGLEEFDPEEHWTEDEQDNISIAVENIESYFDSINFGLVKKKASGIMGKEYTWRPMDSQILSVYLDNMIGPAGIDSKIEEILSSLSDAEREHVVDKIRGMYSKRGRPEVTKDEIARYNASGKVEAEYKKLIPDHTREEIIAMFRGKSEHKFNPVIYDAYIAMADMIETQIADDAAREALQKMADEAEETEEDAALRTSLSEEELIERETRLKALDALAPFFGFKAASGLRQWRRKFADAKFTALMGSEVGRPEYLGYADRIFNNMATLLDYFTDLSEKALSNMQAKLDDNPDDEELKDMISGVEHIHSQFGELHQASLDDEEGLIPADLLLTTAAGYMLREAFAEAYFNKQFRDYASDMKKHMIPFLQTLGLDENAAATFTKMFNGEVELVSFNSPSKQAQKIRDGGVTRDIYNEAMKESGKFTKEFYTGQRQVNDEKAFLAFIGDESKIKNLFVKSIENTGAALEFESKISRKQMTPDQLAQLEDEDVIAEIHSAIYDKFKTTMSSEIILPRIIAAENISLSKLTPSQQQNVESASREIFDAISGYSTETSSFPQLSETKTCFNSFQKDIVKHIKGDFEGPVLYTEIVDTIGRAELPEKIVKKYVRVMTPIIKKIY